MPSIYELLHQDHDKVKKALTRILDTSDGAAKTREKLFSEIKQDLEIHTRFEEEVFYPQFRDAKGDEEAEDAVDDALDEHAEAKGMLEKLSSMDKSSDEFLETLDELKQALEHHISDEEEEMFPEAREALDDEKAREMGDRYEQMKQGAMAGGR
ncbi:MAG: hemerythrin domain-containing protein [Woeseia sp.]